MVGLGAAEAAQLLEPPAAPGALARVALSFFPFIFYFFSHANIIYIHLYIYTSSLASLPPVPPPPSTPHVKEYVGQKWGESRK